MRLWSNRLSRKRMLRSKKDGGEETVLYSLSMVRPVLNITCNNIYCFNLNYDFVNQFHINWCYICSNWGTGKHGVHRECSEPRNLLLWIYEHEHDQVCHHSHQPLGDCIPTHPRRWIHLRYLLVAIQNLFHLHSHWIGGTYVFSFNLMTEKI